MPKFFSVMNSFKESSQGFFSMIIFIEPFHAGAAAPRTRRNPAWAGPGDAVLL
jgi:hypothetical protein